MDLKNQLKFLGIQHHNEMVDIFQSTRLGVPEPTSRKRKKERPLNVPGRGMFTFLMRSIMIRHSQAQKYTATNTTLMSLPPKVSVGWVSLLSFLLLLDSFLLPLTTLSQFCFLWQTERIVTVKFSEEEKKEYIALENGARAFYQNFKATTGQISKHYLKLTQKLSPLRIACAGGCLPLDDDGSTDNPDEGEQDGSDDDIDDGPQKRKKKEQKFSDFSFSSKLQTLVHELETVREKDKTGESESF